MHGNQVKGHIRVLRVFCERYVPLKFLTLFILSTFSSVSAAQECSAFKAKGYKNINVTEKNVSDSIYTDINFIDGFGQRDSVESIIKRIESGTDSLWAAKVNCVDEMHIFFSLWLYSEKAELMDGVFLIESGRYSSGPHSFVSSDTIFILADKP